MKLKKRYKAMWITISIAVLVIAGIRIFMNSLSFGRLPRGERLARIEASPNYRGGSFKNLSETPQLTSDKGISRQALSFLLRKTEKLRPGADIPAVKTDLKNLPVSQDIIVWLGHGSYFIQLDGKKFLVDPVFYNASPVGWYNKEFNGTGIYKPADMPSIDYLVITHDHWDHLDHRTVKELKASTGKVICPLGVGEHFEYWGYGPSVLIEMDWQDSVPLGDNFVAHCLPARHFSGRGTKPNRTLWASYMLETPSRRIYIGGDGGYDTHFAEIGRRFGPIDLAILENGQYDEDWKFIHLLPADLVKAIADLSPRSVLTVHHSKYALGKHAWDEPLENISAAAERDGIRLLTPMIGQPVYLDRDVKYGKWWKNIGGR